MRVVCTREAAADSSSGHHSARRLSLGSFVTPAARAAAAVVCAAALASPATATPFGPDSAGWSPVAPGRGVADTVTVLPPVNVGGVRSVAPDRTTATGVRLGRSTLMRFLPVNAADALVSIPGVDLVKTGPWASRISLRGMSGDRVLVMVDGVRLNGVRGHGVQASMLSLDRIEGVELLPGASSAQFGSDALGGAINFVTHRNLFGPEAAVSAVLAARGADPGGMGVMSGRAAFLSPRLGLEVAAGGGASERLVTPQGRIPNSSHREQFTTARLVARLGRALVDAEHSRQAAYDVGLPAFNSSAGATGRYPLQVRDGDRLELALPDRGNLPEARLLASIQTMRSHFTEITVDSNYLRGRFIATRTTVAADRARTRIASLQPSLRFPGLSALRLMGEYRRETTGGPRVTEQTVRNAAGSVTGVSTTLGESMPPARRDVWSGAMFAPLSVRGLKLESGVRYDAIRSRSDSTAYGSIASLDASEERWSGEAGLARRFGGLEPYVHLATGFRAPNLEERYYNSEVHGGLRLFGNPRLVAEHSATWEAGVRASHLGLLQEGRLSMFRSGVREMITFHYVGQLYLVPRFQYVNVERARIEGIEAALQLRAAAVSMAIDATFPRAVDAETGERLADAGAARVIVEAGVPMAYALPQGRFTLRVRWNDAIRGVDPTLVRPAFTVSAAEMSSVISGVRAVIAVRNLWNASYREPLSFIPEPKRTYALSLRREFGGALPFRRGSR